MHSHMEGRLDSSRRLVVPWLDAVKPLKGARVLEIGCGSGSATVALAEQGAQVVAVDIDHPSMRVAQIRSRSYRLETVHFVQANAADVHRLLPGLHFDFVIFYASLEHMTHEERLAAMRHTWQMLSPGDMWVIVDSPNRLWPYDSHTSELPFFMWLPDNLAREYTRFSNRESFRDLHAQADADTQLLRWGRGVSYHEFDLAMKPIVQLRVASALRFYHRRGSLLRRLRDLISAESRVESMLARSGPPGVHRGFYRPYLDLIIEKD